MSMETLPEGAELERTLEAIEQKMYEDFYSVVPEALARARGITISRDGSAVRMTASGIDHPFFNRVMGLGLDAPVDQASIAAHVEHYRTHGVTRFMLQILPHVETPALREDMASFGFERLRGWAKHVGEAGWLREAPTDLRIEEIGPDRAEVWAALCARGFTFPEELEPWLAAIPGLTGWHPYLAFSGTEPVACAAFFRHGPYAELNFGATASEYRGRGGQSGLVARRIADAAAQGCRWILSETDEELPDRPNPSYHNLVRLGLPVRYVRANWGPPKPT
jgi:GNAT superfamily N-acetyltransferase